MLRFLGLKYAGFFAADDVVRQGSLNTEFPAPDTQQHIIGWNSMILSALRHHVNAFDTSRIQHPANRTSHLVGLRLAITRGRQQQVPSPHIIVQTSHSLRGTHTVSHSLEEQRMHPTSSSQ